MRQRAAKLRQDCSAKGAQRAGWAGNEGSKCSEYPRERSLQWRHSVVGRSAESSLGRVSWLVELVFDKKKTLGKFASVEAFAAGGAGVGDFLPPRAVDDFATGWAGVAPVLAHGALGEGQRVGGLFTWNAESSTG